MERWSRYVMLFRLPHGHTADAVRAALAATVQQLPTNLWQSLTWDQGKEMAQHTQFTMDTGIQVYFCDPKSPWQRGSNENTNGLLRQYFPKGTDMSALRWRLHEREPGFDPPSGSLSRYGTLAAIDQLLDGHHSVVAGVARREVTRIRELTTEANQFEADITTRVTRLVPSLLAIPGCGALSAAKLVGEAADISRFKSRDAYAMSAGTVPIPVWSANNTRFRLNRGGNRQTNAALHCIAVTQIRIHPDAQASINGRLQTGSTKREALRLLKRKLANVVYRTLLADTQQALVAKTA